MGNVLSSLIYKKAKSQEFDSVIHAYMIENSFSKKLSKDYMGEPFKRYALYGLSLNDTKNYEDSAKKTA